MIQVGYSQQNVPIVCKIILMSMVWVDHKVKCQVVLYGTQLVT